MKLSTNEFRLVSVREASNENGKFTFLKFADKSTFENADFIAGRKLDLRDVCEGHDYLVTLEVDGKYMSVCEMCPA